MMHDPSWQVAETDDLSPPTICPPPEGYLRAGPWEPIGPRSGGRVGVMWRRPIKIELKYLEVAR